MKNKIKKLSLITLLALVTACKSTIVIGGAYIDVGVSSVDKVDVQALIDSQTNSKKEATLKALPF